jgi:hypothetical protein
VKITIYTRAFEVCEVIAKEIRIKNINDFKLFIYSSIKEERFLEDDEVIADIFALHGRENVQSTGFFKKLKKMFEKKKQNKIVFYLRKKIFFSRDLEENDYQQDPIRI